MAISEAKHNEVIIAGAGPVGLLIALLLARASIPITLLESSQEAPTEDDPAGTKAIVYQPPLYPLLKKASLFDEMKQIGRMSGLPVFRQTKTKEVVVALPKPPNAPGILVLPQWRFCKLIENKLQNMDGVRILRGHRVIDLKAETESVNVIAETPSGDHKEFNACYLIGADGGRSTVRKRAGITFSGETLPSQLVATDVKYPFHEYGFCDTQFMMDAEDFGLIGYIDDGLWRVSFAMPDGASNEAIHESLPEKYERMFPGPRPLKYEIKNVAPYRCQQLCANTMTKGRVLLAGDSAHLTNPYAGLGLTTGFFDADSLAEVLISVINRGASEDLLDTWSNARLDMYKKLVDPLSRAAFYRVQTSEVESLFEKDSLFKSAKAGVVAPPPSMATDVSKFSEFVA